MPSRADTLVHKSAELSATSGFPPGFCLTDELSDYVQLLQGCCRSYADDIEFDKLFGEAFTKLNSRGINEVSLGVLAGRAEDMIEWGMRLCTGSGGAQKDIPMALALWQHITSPSTLYPPLSQPPSRRILATAYSLQAKVYKDRAHIDVETLQIGDMHRAAVAADAAAAQGLVTPIVLFIAQFVAMPFGPRGDASLKDMPQFACLSDLWCIWERRNEEMQLEQLARDRKVSRAPNAYRCAAEGCGIEGTKKATLLRCAGKCQGANKPHYCSKECQRKDWKRHKPMCKPGVPSPANGPIDHVALPVEEASRSLGHGGGDALSNHSPWDEDLLPRVPGKERMITVPAPGPRQNGADSILHDDPCDA
ncbi:uncharacterized protein B0H18DRAFT_1117350 [Fomitopsis serialis]|uniref:uncharacterized protein n=1 Tax=Fomitopsis serialis TaxID=139415 RepID=UPI00200754F2|nr:uncharacterized protein B0H18DRAFT_1117350 [Neoantrodia serialis]KAH9929821.1 hypothetical protein B0H18DRAFT_1117350 [Neoantrodia serialis]